MDGRALGRVGRVSKFIVSRLPAQAVFRRGLES